MVKRPRTTTPQKVMTPPSESKAVSPAVRKMLAKVPRRCPVVRKLDLSSEVDEQQDVSVGVEEMAQLKDRIYSECTNKRKVGGWATCSKFILEPFIDKILRVGKVTEKDTFLDIGSGVGNVVMSVATRAGCACTGVEITKRNHHVAEEALSLFTKHWKESKRAVPKVDLHNSDIRAFLTDEAIAKYSVVWAANLLFPIEVDCFLLSVLRKFKPGTRIFLLKDLVVHNKPHSARQAEDHKYFTFTDLQWDEGDVEWCGLPGSFWMYTRTDYTGN